MTAFATDSAFADKIQRVAETITLAFRLSRTIAHITS
jgi:hypothetical protein